MEDRRSNRKSKKYYFKRIEVIKKGTNLGSQISPLKFEAPRVGFEPTTNRLTADCSATELPRNQY